MKPLYPLSAIVGQEDLVLALTICAVSPNVGGVLIRGDKGSAKSTAARAIAEVMPAITKKLGCRYNCEANMPAITCDICQTTRKLDVESNGIASCADSPQSNEPISMPVPFVNLPLGVTEERLIGTLDLDKMLTKSEKAFQPGLLAASNRGVLYIDEINLLADHLVDLLLDAAAMGVNVVEREGFSISHAAKITLIGTMNPEEGDLRPQLLDRFGLMVQVKAPSDPNTRALVVGRRIAFDQSPKEFCQQYQSAQAEMRSRIIKARELVRNITLSESMLIIISTICSEMGIASLRADIVMGQVAKTIAALDERVHVTVSDLSTAARLVLPHRKRTKPGESCGIDENKLEEQLKKAEAEAEANTSPTTEKGVTEKSNIELYSEHEQTKEKDKENNENTAAENQVFATQELANNLSIETEDNQVSKSNLIGQHAPSGSSRRGRHLRDKPDTAPTSIAINTTIKHSLVRNGTVQISKQDLHQKQRQAHSANLVIFAVDCSGSMAALKRVELVKGAIKELIANAYQKRDQIALITFAGSRAKLLLPPTRSIEKAEELIAAAETGGRTPLPSALSLVETMLTNLKLQDGEPLLVLLSDGKANVAIKAEGDAWQETIVIAEKLREKKLATIVIDTEAGFVRLGRARELAQKINGEYVSLSTLSVESLSLIVRRCLNGRQNRNGIKGN